jgi:peptidoglycan/xylan/chitin deacetylase (PgdA/CDA1 family)/O-antigen/teichoic acid export membrane protein
VTTAPDSPSGIRLNRSAVTRRVTWTLTDQALSSFTNFAVGITIARTTSSAGLGTFAIAFSIYVVATGLSRSMTTDPLMIRESATDRNSMGDSVGAATGLAALIGVVTSLAILPIAVLSGGELRTCLFALCCVLPGLLLQESWRYVFFTEGRPQTAAGNDLIWAIALIVAFAGVFAAGVESAATLILAWGAAATVAALVGIRQARHWPRPQFALQWLRRHRDINVRFAIEFMVSVAALQLLGVMLAAVAGLAATGTLQGALLLVGPLNIVLLAANPVGIPELVRIRERRGLRGVVVGTVVISALAAGAACAWLAFAFSIPAGVGKELLGDTWLRARAIVPGVAIYSVAMAAGLGPQTGLRSLAAAKQVLRVRALGSVVLFALAIPLAITSGVVGVAWALAASQIFSTLLWWFELRRYLSRGSTELESSVQIAGRKPIPLKGEQRGSQTQAYVTISVDDGHPSDLRTADLLAALGYAATFYVPARNAEHDVMDSNGVRRLAEGFEVGSHTYNHLPLTRLSHDDARREIAQGKAWLEDVLSSAVSSFCYPRGKFSARVAELVADAGFVGARTTMNSLLSAPSDPFRWGVSTQALSHSRAIQVRHALLEHNWLGVDNYARVFRWSREWTDHFERAVSHVSERGGIAHLWFHSWKLDEADQWAELELLLDRLKTQYSFKCATNGELFARLDTALGLDGKAKRPVQPGDHDDRHSCEHSDA